MTRTRLSAAEARRIAIAAQGLDRRQRARPDLPTMRHLSGVVQRTGVLQVDSVNVLARAHLMPLFSRLGAYDTDLLRRASETRPRRLMETWAHVQAYAPVDTWPLLHHRRERYRQAGPKWGGEVPAKMAAVVLDRLRDEGPSTASDLDDGAPRSKDHWGWNWSASRRVLDYLFISGEAVIAGRTRSFEPVYDLPERALPRDVLDAPVPPTADAVRELVRRATRSLGVAAAPEIADYYRMRWQPGGESARAYARDAVYELVEMGELIPVDVAGWGQPAWLHRDARIPRRVEAAALLSPFDPLVWHRERTERIFDFHYRIEIYVPAAQRRWGYYVLPFVLGDEIVARVDLKADRRSDGGVLRVLAAYAEPGRARDREQVAYALAAELDEMAAWLGLRRTVVGHDGDLAAQLAAIGGWGSR